MANEKEITIRSKTQTLAYEIPGMEPVQLQKPVFEERFKLEMPDKHFNDILSDAVSRREIEGYEPNRVLIWMPVYWYFEQKLKEQFGDDFKLSVYIREQFNLEPIVIDLDEREHDWLKNLMFYVYEDPLNRKDRVK